MELMIDIGLTEDGDLAFDDGDLTIVQLDKYLFQQAMCRIKSIKQDWFIDNIGADMEELIGEPNTTALREKGKSKLIEALTDDGFLADEDIVISIVGSDKVSIVYDIKIRSSEQVGYLPIQVTLDLTQGIFVS